MKRGGLWSLAGVVSVAVDGGRWLAFTNVRSHLDWLERQLDTTVGRGPVFYYQDELQLKAGEGAERFAQGEPLARFAG